LSMISVFYVPLDLSSGGEFRNVGWVWMGV